MNFSLSLSFSHNYISLLQHFHLGDAWVFSFHLFLILIIKRFSVACAAGSPVQEAEKWINKVFPAQVCLLVSHLSDCLRSSSYSWKIVHKVLIYGDNVDMSEWESVRRNGRKNWKWFSANEVSQRRLQSRWNCNNYVEWNDKVGTSWSDLSPSNEANFCSLHLKLSAQLCR